MSPIYTKQGDEGNTSLQNNMIVKKNNDIIKAMSAIDELNAQLGIIKSRVDAENIKAILEYEQIQRHLMGIMSLISSNTKATSTMFDAHAAELESKIDQITDILPKQTAFILYGACETSAALDVARAIARRAETALVQAEAAAPSAKSAFKYMNRLSDYLYMKARYEDFEQAITTEVKKALKMNTPAPMPVETSSVMNLHTAKKIMHATEQKAASQNLPIVIACCDDAGNPVAVHVMDNAYLASYEVALGKAYTAAALKMNTMDLNKLVQPGEAFYGLEALGSGKIVPIGGGVPLLSQDNKLIGSIGVSGGNAVQDHALAEYAKEVFYGSTD